VHLAYHTYLITALSERVCPLMQCRHGVNLLCLSYHTQSLLSDILWCLLALCLSNISTSMFARKAEPSSTSLSGSGSGAGVGLPVTVNINSTNIKLEDSYQGSHKVSKCTPVKVKDNLC